MKKELFIHFSFLLIFFLLISLFRRWISIDYLPFWLGGILGTLLPDLDHLIYIYYLSPQDLTSQRAASMLSRREVFQTLDLLADTRYERTRLIFHTILFQGIFVILTFLIITSSGNLFGRGLVLGFLLHLVIDQLVDFMKTDGISTWFNQIAFLKENLSQKERALIYWLANLSIVLIFGFLF